MNLNMQKRSEQPGEIEGARKELEKGWYLESEAQDSRLRDGQCAQVGDNA